MRAFVAVLVIFITVEIYGRHVGMSMKRVKQEVYNALKQENMITPDQDASVTDNDGNSSVEQTSSRDNFPVTDSYSPSAKKKIKMFNKLGQTLAVATDRVKGSTRFNTQDSKFWGWERVDDFRMNRRPVPGVGTPSSWRWELCMDRGVLLQRAQFLKRWV